MTRHRATTLVEMLAAVALASMLLAAASASIVQLASLDRAQEESRRNEWADNRAGRTFEADVSRNLCHAGGFEETFKIVEEPDQLLQMVTLCRYAQAEALHRFLPCRVEYRLRRADDADGVALVRHEEPLTTIGRDRTQVLDHGLSEVRVEFHVDGDWLSLAKISEPLGTPVKAVRFGIARAGGKVEDEIVPLRACALEHGGHGR